jgi:hypothetical protein
MNWTADRELSLLPPWLSTASDLDVTMQMERRNERNAAKSW